LVFFEGSLVLRFTGGLLCNGNRLAALQVILLDGFEQCLVRAGCR